MAVKNPVSRIRHSFTRMKRPIWRGLFVVLTLFLWPPNFVSATSEAIIVVPDKLCEPGDDIFVEAYLYRKGILAVFHPQIQGELLRFVGAKGREVGALLTDPSGMARVPYRAERPGKTSFTVRLAENPRYEVDPAEGTVFVRQMNKPLFFILIEGGLTEASTSVLFQKDLNGTSPSEKSKEVTKRISSTSTLVYLSSRPRIRIHPMKAWLHAHEFPDAPLLSVEETPSVEALMNTEQEMDTRLLQSLWKDPKQPACLVTGNRTFAKAASSEGLTVFFLQPVPESPTDHGEERVADKGKSSPGKDATRKEEQKEAEAASKAKEETFFSFQGWEEIPSECRHPEAHE